MEIVRFTDENEQAASLYGVTPAELRTRDDRQAQPVRRWIATRDGEAVGAVAAWLRPDDHMFLRSAGPEAAAYGSLAGAATADLGRAVHTIVDSGIQPSPPCGGSDSIPRWLPSGFGFGSPRHSPGLIGRGCRPDTASSHADWVDWDRLFTLDNALRNDTR